MKRETFETTNMSFSQIYNRKNLEFRSQLQVEETAIYFFFRYALNLCKVYGVFHVISTPYLS